MNLFHFLFPRRTLPRGLVEEFTRYLRTVVQPRPPAPELLDQVRRVRQDLELIERYLEARLKEKGPR